MGRLVKNPPLAKNAGTATSGHLPGGTTATRPSGTFEGELRYNSDNNFLEFWNGTAWKSMSGAGLISVTQDSFTGDAVVTDFTFAAVTPVNDVRDILVFVGGVFQNPATAYTLISAGAEISFTSAPPNLEAIVVLHGLNEVA